MMDQDKRELERLREKPILDEKEFRRFEVLEEMAEDEGYLGWY